MSFCRYLAIKFHEMEEKLQRERNRNRIPEDGGDDLESNAETSTVESIQTTENPMQTDDPTSTVSIEY